MATAFDPHPDRAPLFARIMGTRFALLPPTVQHLHSGDGTTAATGAAEVVRGRNPLARLVARLFGFPPTGAHRLTVTFAADADSERWTRDFGGHCFTSHLSQAGNSLVERFGPYRFRFDLVSDDGGLAMRMTGWSLAHMALPMRLAPRSLAREWQHDGTFHFAVALALPMIGDVVRYTGWLRPE